MLRRLRWDNALHSTERETVAAATRRIPLSGRGADGVLLRGGLICRVAKAPFVLIGVVEDDPVDPSPEAPISWVPGIILRHDELVMRMPRAKMIAPVGVLDPFIGLDRVADPVIVDELAKNERGRRFLGRRRRAFSTGPRSEANNDCE